MELLEFASIFFKMKPLTDFFGELVVVGEDVYLKAKKESCMVKIWKYLLHSQVVTIVSGLSAISSKIEEEELKLVCFDYFFQVLGLLENFSCFKDNPNNFYE